MPRLTRAEMRSAEDVCSPGCLTAATVAWMLGVPLQTSAFYTYLRESGLPHRHRRVRGQPGVSWMLEIPVETAARLLWRQCREQICRAGQGPTALRDQYSRLARSGVIPDEPPWLKRVKPSRS